ncbi:MAG: M50 family metallopeptidase [Myxococcota bacterium]|nr:M50 family metallopeptidase [Myxococcota bacterium]
MLQPGRELESQGRSVSGVDWRTVGLLGAIFVVVALLWGTVLVTPLKIFVVLLHEVSHALATWLTGGEVLRIEVNAMQGGLCVSRGGNSFVVLSAGYLGSMLWGATLLILAARTRLDRWLSVGIGLFLIGVTLLFVRNLFGFFFAGLSGAAMIVIGLKLPEKVNDLILKVIGVTSCLYAVLDIIDDVLRRPGIGSDADQLARLTHIPSMVWGVLWIVLALVVTGIALWIAAAGDGRPATEPVIGKGSVGSRLPGRS